VLLNDIAIALVRSGAGWDASAAQAKRPGSPVARPRSGRRTASRTPRSCSRR